MNAPLWTVKTVPHHKSRRWYALHWNGAPLEHLKDGRTSGRYKYRRDAQERADALNESERLKEAIIGELWTPADVGRAIRNTERGPAGTMVTLVVFVPDRLSDRA